MSKEIFQTTFSLKKQGAVKVCWSLPLDPGANEPDESCLGRQKQQYRNCHWISKKESFVFSVFFVFIRFKSMTPTDQSPFWALLPFSFKIWQVVFPKYLKLNVTDYLKNIRPIPSGFSMTRTQRLLDSLTLSPTRSAKLIQQNRSLSSAKIPRSPSLDTAARATCSQH